MKIQVALLLILVLEVVIRIFSCQKMCNSIKNLIQQNKIEPSIQNAVNASSSVVYGPASTVSVSSGPPSSQGGPRSGSISYEKKKSRDDSSPVVSVHSVKQLSQDENIPIIDDDESGPSTSQ